MEKINKKKVDEWIQKSNPADSEESESDTFSMSDDEKAAAKNTGFNSFWITKTMEYNKVYKFRIVSDSIITREIEDNFAGKPTKRMIISIQDLETEVVWDLVTQYDKNKEGNYSSMTLAMRRLYALTNGNVKDRIIVLSKKQYKHERWGDTDSYTINFIDEMK